MSEWVLHEQTAFLLIFLLYGLMEVANALHSTGMSINTWFTCIMYYL